mgnify:CR=1 FL=1
MFSLFSRPASAALVTASLLACASALPVAAQTASPTPPAAAQAPDSPGARPSPMGEAQRPGSMSPHGRHHGERSRGAEVKVDFGGGRKLHLSCGDTPVDACLRAAQPLAEMVSEAGPVPHHPAMSGHMGPKGPKPEDRGPEAPRP